MKEVIFDQLLKKIPNKYLLTVIAGKRAREIYSGAEPYMDCDEKDTVVSKVFSEILADKIVVEDEIAHPTNKETEETEETEEIEETKESEENEE